MLYEELKKQLNKALELKVPYIHPEEVEELGLESLLRSFQSKAGRPAGVLALLVLPSDAASWKDAELLLTMRSQKVEAHRGQLSFPGGAQEDSDTDLIETALRETEEEVGISPKMIEVLGQLDSFNVFKSGFEVLPSVGVLKATKEEISFRISRDEIDEVHWVSLSHLLDPSNYYKLYFEHEGAKYPVHHFKLEALEERLWGATAAMTMNLLDRLRAVLP